MFSDQNRRAAIFLLFVTRGIVSASTFDRPKGSATMIQKIVEAVQAPWLKGFESITHSAESACEKDIEVFLTGVETHESWALEMLDASSQIDSGIFAGNTVHFGVYSQCIGVNANYENVTVQGKYCKIATHFENLKLISSVCIPSSCDERHAVNIAKFVIDNMFENSSVEMESKDILATCLTVHPEKFTNREILTITFLSVIGAFIIFCTICDISNRNWPAGRRPPSAVNNLAKFSLYTNALAIFNTQSKPGTLPALNGFRFLSTCWIVALHSHESRFIQRMSDLRNLGDYPVLPTALWNQLATFATDNFLLISGFFVSYLFFKKMKRRREFNLPMMYLHRYIRLTPCIAVATLVISVFYDRMGNGPLWKTVSFFTAGPCQDNWWMNFLYIQNFVTSANRCIMQSWFLATDMQLFVISPIILYPLYRWPKYGIGAWSLFLFASVLTPTIVIDFHGCTITGLPSIDSFDHYYIRPYTRAFPYVLGILLGSDIVTEKKKQLSQIAVTACWILASILLIYSSLMIYLLKNHEIKNNSTFQTIGAASVRQCWSLSMAWLIYACNHGHGGLIAKFLSLPTFTSLSRLSYGIYLVHVAIICARRGVRTVFNVEIKSYTFDFYLADMFLSITLSTMISLFFEMPIMTLETILTKRSRTAVQAFPKSNVEQELEGRIENENTNPSFSSS